MSLINMSNYEENGQTIAFKSSKLINCDFMNTFRRRVDWLEFDLI